MKKWFLIIAVLASSAAVLVSFFPALPEKIPDKELLGEKIIETAREIQATITAPEPLRTTLRAPETLLTRAGVIAETNRERRQGGLLPLAANAVLNNAATLKLEDMKKRNYFDHVSPDGTGPEHWPAIAGYRYIMVGENLALGDFQDDKALVESWVESPGHRANIMHERYTEIGVAVGRGTIDGQETWIAVQVFGLPKSACPEPDAALKQTLDEEKSALDAKERLLEQKRQELEAYHDDEVSYNRAAEEYNALVKEFNADVSVLKEKTALYNSQIVAFNACVKGE